MTDSSAACGHRRLVEDDRLVELLETVDRGVPAGAVLRAVEVAEERAAQDVIDERRFAAAAHAGDAREAAERKRRGDALEIVFARAGDGEPARVVLVTAVLRRDVLRAFALLRHGDFRAAAEILRGERVFDCAHFVERALRDELAAAFARAGAEVDDVVGATDRVLVLDNDHRNCRVAQAPQRADEPLSR